MRVNCVCEIVVCLFTKGRRGEGSWVGRESVCACQGLHLPTHSLKTTTRSRQYTHTHTLGNGQPHCTFEPITLPLCISLLTEQVIDSTSLRDGYTAQAAPPNDHAIHPHKPPLLTATCSHRYIPLLKTSAADRTETAYRSKSLPHGAAMRERCAPVFLNLAATSSSKARPCAACSFGLHTR